METPGKFPGTFETLAQKIHMPNAACVTNPVSVACRSAGAGLLEKRYLLLDRVALMSGPECALLLSYLVGINQENPVFWENVRLALLFLDKEQLLLSREDLH